LGRDVVLVVGPEPSLRWQAVLGELADLAVTLGVERAFTLSGIPSLASHRRPVVVHATANNRTLTEEVGGRQGNAQGPVGAATVLQVMLGERGIGGVSLWAQVPHYVAGGPSPIAIRALLSKLRDLGGVGVDLATVDEQSRSYVARVDEGLAARPDVADVVRRIEAGEAGDAADLPTGDELASEIARFLRAQP